MASTHASTFEEGPRPFTITENDHRGVVMSLAVLFILYAVMIIGMRLAARMRTMGWDDYLAILATFLSVIQFTTVAVAVSHLFGASYDQYSSDDVVTVAKILRASDVLFIISLFVTKCAVIWLCRRLFSVNQKAPRRVCEGVMALSACWCLASILVVTISCEEEAAIGLGNGTCAGLVRRWTIVGALNGLIEIVIIALSVAVVWPLRMSVTKRFSAMACFLFRLPIIVFIALHLYYLGKSTNSSNRGVAVSNVIIFRQAELLFSLFSAAVPALNQYLRKFSTVGTAAFGYSPGAYGAGGYGLKSMTRRTKKSQSSQSDTTTGKDNFAPNHCMHYRATVDYHAREEHDSSADGVSLGRHNSDDMIIRKDIAYEVSYSEGIDQSGTGASKAQPHRA